MIRPPAVPSPLEGRQWCLTPPLNISDRSSIPEFICISYLWGQGRSPNPFWNGTLMSDQTLPAVAAVMRNCSSTAFWTDSFCVPADQPRRSATLESMGFIYNLASAVFIALSAPTFAVLDQMNRSDRVSGEQLRVLDQDELVSSVWTYQEIINSQKLRLVSSHPGAAVLDGSVFLNRLGYSLQLHGREIGLNTFELSCRFPRLDALSDLLADWMMTGYCEISALQALSNLDRRFTAEPKNYFYSLLGVFSKSPVWGGQDSTVADLSQKFMAICEQKNDYSFIYSSSPRDETAGRRWRPRPGLIHVVLAWHHSEQGMQRAHTTSEGFWLDAMMEPDLSGHLSPTAKQAIIKSLKLSTETDNSDTVVASQAFDRLQQIGFTGSNTYLISTEGLFFPQIPVEEGVRPVIMVATGIRWVFGAPAIARMDIDGTETFTAGVFVGTQNRDRISSVLLDKSPAVRG